MKSFAFAATMAAVNAISPIEFEYMNYIAKFSKFIDDVEEFAFRLENFRSTHEFI